MKVFIYEWVSGGGFFDRSTSAPPTLCREGAAMLVAVASDFAGLPNVTAVTLVDPAADALLPSIVACRHASTAVERDHLFAELTAAADRTVIIAPEFEGILLGLSQKVTDLGGCLLSPSPAFIEVASDKQATVEHLLRAGVRVARGTVLMPGERCPAGFAYPAVLKPFDGCGSLGIHSVDADALVPGAAGAYRLEELVQGVPASVAVLCGSDRTVPLEPCVQRLQGDFSYAGGALPLRAELRNRASRLALAAVSALPPAAGYVGVDMVLGEAEDGTRDVVMEINPRYTTSYVGLRAATDANLAGCSLAVSNGEQSDPPLFDRAVQWDSAGTCQVIDNHEMAWR